MYYAIQDKTWLQAYTLNKQDGEYILSTIIYTSQISDQLNIYIK